MPELTLVERVQTLERQMKTARPPTLLELEAGKVIDPARYSVQSRAADTAFAPMGDVAGIGGGVFWITMGTALDETPQWNPIYPNWRDRALLTFSRSEGMLSSAVYSMATRVGTLDHVLNGPPRAKKFAQELLDKPGLGDSFAMIKQKVSSDLDTADNGAFIELWRAGNPDSDAKDRPVLGFAHLDSRQCWRSFDPEFPVWYTNPVTGVIRKLHRSRVVFNADNPQAVELARGIGFCATSRVLRMARTFRSMQVFLDEKVSGRFTRAIGAVSGINANQLRSALQSNAAEADNKGFVIYQDIPFLINPSTEPGNDVKIMLQDLASIPDGFVFRDDADLYAYILAFAFGVDAREFWPATQSGATKADASVQNMKAQGRGIGNRIQTLTAMLRACLPETVEFEFDYSDDAQDLQAAQINEIRARTFDMMVKNGTMSAQDSRAMSIAVGILDDTVLSTLQAPVTSDSNPDTAPGDVMGNTEPNAQPPTTEANNPAQGKAIDNSAFVYVPLPNDPAILEIQKRVQSILGINGITYQEPETFHVTMLYCTDVTDNQLQQVMSDSPVGLPMTIESKHLGLFENGEERALYLEVERDTNLIILQSNVFQAFTRNGLSDQLSPFSAPGGYKPHITLAYLPPGVDIPNLSINLKTAANRYSFGRSEYKVVASKQKNVVMKSFDDYRRSLRALTRGYWAGELSAFDFYDGMAGAISRHFEQAWQEVEKQYGITPDERTAASQSRLDLSISTEISYISGFANAIVENNKANGGALQPMLDRAELWARGYDRTLELAQSIIGPDIKLAWRLGSTEKHCDDCLQYANKVFFKSQWEAAGVRPKFEGLQCTGIQCDCIFEPTTERKTRGEVPVLIGHKHLEAHIHVNGAHEPELAVA